MISILVLINFLKFPAIVPLLWKTHTKNCSENEFRCKYSQKCVNSQFVCDGIIDCGLVGSFNLLDDSDENQNCTKSCEKNEDLCSNGQCLAIEKFCDGVRKFNLLLIITKQSDDLKFIITPRSRRLYK